MSIRKLRSLKKKSTDFDQEELESWFCGSLSLGEFILAPENGDAHLPAAP